LRGTPETEHDRLLSYLALIEDPRSRLQVFEERGLFVVSIHFRPNPGVSLQPEHGGIVELPGGELRPLSGRA
jgi:hypothetical protein